MIFPLQGDQGLKIRVTVDEEDEKAIRQVLVDNADLFAWMTIDLPRVNPRITSQRLSIFSEARPISQEKRKLGFPCLLGPASWSLALPAAVPPMHPIV